MDNVHTPGTDDPLAADTCAGGLAEIDAPAWLAALLEAYAARAVSSAQASAIQNRLRHTAFESIVDAVEQARPGVPGAAEISLYREWINSNSAPTQHLFAAWYNLGVAMERAGDRGNAASAYSHARALKPDFHPAVINLGLSLEAMGHVDAALQTWDSALQSDVARTTLLNHRGRLLEQQGRLAEAEAALRMSLRTDDTQPDAMQHWLHVRQKMCLWPVAGTGSERPDDALLRQIGPLGILALSDSIATQTQVTERWIERKMPPAPEHLAPAAGYRHDRLRIGYVSSDYCSHAMSYLIAELFERHDRRSFEIYGYCSTIDDGSAVRARVLAAFDHCRFIRDMTDEQAARLIRQDEIDILIDLNGLTAHTRLAVLRWRPAPVQATYLGFIGPVPLPELDFFLCDDFVVPPAQAHFYRPAPLPIGPIYQANDSLRAIGAAMTRAEAGLPEDRFVLCCFSRHYKITQAMFAGWMDIMRRAENTVLWLAADNAWSEENLRTEAARAGVAASRILMAPRIGPDAYLRRLELADLFLDTFPYNAGTVASDAIRMRVPLLTLCGESFASRMAGSLLNALGATAGITGNMTEYIDTATHLATDSDAYAAYKMHFAGDAWWRSAGDIQGFTAGLEAALLRVART